MTPSETRYNIRMKNETNNTMTIPTIPADWIAYTGVIPAGNGYRTHIKRVVHKVDGYLQFVIHTAYDYNGEWCFEHGRYFKTEEEALAAFVTASSKEAFSQESA